LVNFISKRDVFLKLCKYSVVVIDKVLVFFKTKGRRLTDKQENFYLLFFKLLHEKFSFGIICQEYSFLFLELNQMHFKQGLFL